MPPLVSVITPTWQRHELLLGRCMPSVAAQTYHCHYIEHIIVSDGPDPELAARIGRITAGRGQSVRFDELPEHDPAARWGHRARLRGLELARGEIIAYLDDDDAWRPDHCAVVARALQEHPEAACGWTRAAAWHQGELIGVLGGEPSYGRVITSAIFHRRELAAPWQPGIMHDQALVDAWLDAGAGYVAAGEETADYYRERPVERPAVVLTREHYQAWRG